MNIVDGHYFPETKGDRHLIRRAVRDMLPRDLFVEGVNSKWAIKWTSHGNDEGDGHTVMSEGSVDLAIATTVNLTAESKITEDGVLTVGFSFPKPSPVRDIEIGLMKVKITLTAAVTERIRKELIIRKTPRYHLAARKMDAPGPGVSGLNGYGVFEVAGFALLSDQAIDAGEGVYYLPIHSITKFR